MTKLYLDELLKGSLGELYFKHYCRQHNYLYAKTENIAREFTAEKRTVTFTLGFDRVRIQIPGEVAAEVFRASQPTNAASPSYVVDFLTCTNWKENRGESAKDFAWVEVKTGYSELSVNQMRFRDECKLRFCIFRIPKVWLPPRLVHVNWEEDLPMKA